MFGAVDEPFQTGSGKFMKISFDNFGPEIVSKLLGKIIVMRWNFIKSFRSSASKDQINLFQIGKFQAEFQDMAEWLRRQT
ncbi:hypothetical protein OUZ56_023980 [Daphnia magna]|uniref:Uncharacterized protein n=1 Tax=Daphnia magna TaxID=35525 RepID=A0ABR0B0K9_9CRUS|nr:hypothetical protein OUZ56_023980 [Daphnia magna]